MFIQIKSGNLDLVYNFKFVIEINYFYLNYISAYEISYLEICKIY